jgi:hypothetical protein
VTSLWIAHYRPQLVRELLRFSAVATADKRMRTR